MDDQDIADVKIIMDKVTAFIATLSEDDAQALIDGRASVILSPVGGVSPSPEPPTRPE